MAVERTGTAVSINTASDSSSQSITVPNDATLAVVFWGGYGTTSNDYFDSGEYTLTLGGSSFTYAARSTSTSDNDDVVCAYLVNPPTGSQTLAWTFNSSINNGFLIGVVFYKGVDTSNPIASSGGNDAATTSPLTIAGLTAPSGSMTVGGVCADNIFGSITGNSQTQILGPLGPDAKGGTVCLSVAEKANSTSFEFAQYNTQYIGMVAIVIAQSAISVSLNQHSFRIFNDDGSESASTAKANLNTNVNVSANDIIRARFLIDATGDPTGKQFQIEFRRKPSGGSFGSWTKV